MQAAVSHHMDLKHLWLESWREFYGHAPMYIGMFALGLVLSALSLGLLAPIFLVGFIRAVDGSLKERVVSACDIFSGFNIWGQALLVGGLSFLVFGAGILLLVLPGVAVMVVWAFALWQVALRGQSAVVALQSAFQLAVSNLDSVLLILVTVIGLNIVGGFLVVGFLVTAPLSLVVMTMAFGTLAESQPVGD